MSRKPNQPPRIHPDQRVYITGQSESGKSYLAASFLAPIKRLVAIDTIGDLDQQFPRMEAWGGSALARFMKGEDARLLIKIPLIEEKEIPQWFDENVVREVLKARNCILYIDEASNVIPSQIGGYKKYSRALFSQGRHYNVGTWISTQRPAGILRNAFSEAQHWFIFTLSDIDDIAVIRRRFGFVPDPPDPHGFYYCTLRQTPVYYDELKVKYVPAQVENDLTVQLDTPTPVKRGWLSNLIGSMKR